MIDAYEMMVDVASEEGRVEKNDDLRLKFFNQAVKAVKTLRKYKPSPEDQDLLSLQSSEVQIRKMQAEEAMKLTEQAKETCGIAAAQLQGFLMAHEPTDEHPAKDMTPAQLANLERCYAMVLPLMAKLGKEQSEDILRYGESYKKLFPNGKHLTIVQNAINQAEADK